MHKSLKDFALRSQSFSILMQICFGCKLLALQPFSLFLCNLDTVHLPLTRLIQCLKPTVVTQLVMLTHMPLV